MAGKLGGKSGNLYWGYNRANIALGALSAANLVSGSSQVHEKDFRISRMKGGCYIDNGTLDQGPIAYGIADGTYTDTEIEECLNARVIDVNQEPEMEQSIRGVYFLGLASLTDGQNLSEFDEKINHTFRRDFNQVNGAWKFWFFNVDNVALTTGGTAHFFTKYWGVWVD